MSKFTRRDFLKGTAAGAIALASSSLLGTVAFADDEASNEIKVSETVDADVVVIGCGASGLMAALTTQAQGINTILLEKGGSCGVSNGCMAGGPALAETRVQAAEDATVSQQTLYDCEYGFSRGTVNGQLLRKCIAQGERVVSNFMDNGVNMGLRVDAYGMGFRARHNFANTEGKQVSGPSRFQPLVDKFVADGGTFIPNREGLEPVMTDGAVTGVIARNTEDDSYVQYNAKAVLVATGGYAGNPERLKEHFGDVDIWPLCNVLSDGKGYDLVVKAGGIADRNWALCCNEFGGANPKIAGANGPGMAFISSALKFAIYGGLIVNKNGDRFMNEQYLTDRPLALGGEMSLRETKYYAVVDQEMLEKVRDGGPLEYYGDPQDWYVGQTGYKGVSLPDLEDAVKKAIEEGWCASGTLAECAAAFGLTNLEAEVAAYNKLCEAGQDDQFYKSSYLLKPLSGDTYYVFEYIPSIWCTFGGVKTDAYCRALNAKQEVIPGLYVAGVDNGSLYASPYYENEGAALGTAYTSGIVAGDCIAEFVKG